MSTPTSLYQLKVTLNGIKPPIWRRILVPDSISLYQLHRILQVVMGWEGYHMHQFTIAGKYYGDAEYDIHGRIEDEGSYKLHEVIKRKGVKFTYEYDFGDSWEHTIQVEAILPVEKGQPYPVCLAGERACPPEDVGGVWGYKAFLTAISDPSHPDHDDMIDWCGGGFDPEFFDIEAVNRNLRRYAPRARK